MTQSARQSAETLGTLALGTLGPLSRDEATEASLTRWWSELNVRCFDGALPAARCSVGRCASPRAMSESQRGDDGVWRVQVAPYVAQAGEVYAVAQLLHEAVHVLVQAKYGDREERYDGHGPRFVAIANATALRVGLAVRTHERGGRPGCLTPGLWPGLWSERQRALSNGADAQNDVHLPPVVDTAPLHGRLAELGERVARLEAELAAERAALARARGVGEGLDQAVTALTARRDGLKASLDALQGRRSGGVASTLRVRLAMCEEALTVVQGANQRT